MWGVKAVFYVAVLVCLIGSTIADCNDNGIMGSNECICASGFKPTDSCANSINVGGNTCAAPVTVDPIIASNFPSLAIGSTDTTFTGNVLHARIEAQYVYNRSYTSLKFTPLTGNTPDVRCNLGTHSNGDGDITMGFWIQSTRQNVDSSCNDTFQLNLPWSQHPQCGFANDTRSNGLGSDSDYLVLTGYLAITYTDVIGVVENFTLARTTKVPYSISVKFQKHVTVTLKALNVSSNVKFGMALTEDVFDPNTGILTLELTTIVNWPNMFYLASEATQLFNPSQVLLQTVNKNTGALCTASGANCDNPIPGAQAYSFFSQDDPTDGCVPDVEDSICKEIFTFQAKVDPTDPVNNCTFDGDYFLQVFLYTCRGSGSKTLPTCTRQQLNISWTISQSNICGQIGVTPDVHGQLIAFPPQYTSNFRTNYNNGLNVQVFSLGSFGHFYAMIESDNNIISLNFTEIKFQQTVAGVGTGSPTYLYQKGTYPVSKYLTIYDQSKYFRIEFHSSIFRVDPNSIIVYTFSATADVAFQGNDGFVDPLESRKRTVEYTWTQSSASASTHAYIKNTASAPASAVTPAKTDAGVNSMTFIASVVGAVAGTMIIVFVVVGFALRSRSEKKDEVHASLVAASAAAEMVNRA